MKVIANTGRSAPRHIAARPLIWLSVTLLSMLLPCSSFATAREIVSTITKLYTFPQFGNGDVVIQLVSTPTGCTKGFWLSPSDPGFKTTYALLLSAYLAQTPVRIAGEDTQLWTGSGDVYSRMTFAGGH